MLISCNGWRSKKPPIHLNPNMDFQPKNKAQSQSLEQPLNVVPWGNEESFVEESERSQYLQSDTILYDGKTKNDQWVKKIPITVNHALVDRGQNRYNIYCTPCHGLDGSGNAAVTQRGWIKPAAYWDSRIVNYTDGELYDIVKTDKMNVNSAHHQSVNKTPKNITINAIAPDGIIEGIEDHKYKWCMGVQWHPEFLISSHDEKIYNSFISACK